MRTSPLLLTIAVASVLMLMLTSPVNMIPVDSYGGNTSNVTMTTTHPPNPEHHFLSSRFTTIVRRLVKAWQTIWFLLKQHEGVPPFEYCFVMNITNIQTSNLTIEGRLIVDYQVLKELMIPLRDVVDYEAHISNNSDTYQKLAWVQTQINTSLEEIRNVQNSDWQAPPLQDVPTGQNSELTINHSTTNNSTQFQGQQCADGVVNPVDEFRDLYEIQIGLNFAVYDLVQIQHDLDPNYPHGNSS